MAEDLGVARLVVVADTRQALQALDQLRSRVSTGVGNVGDGLFKDIEAKATAAGISAGTAFKQGFDAASKTQKLKFENFTEALEFNPKNTIKGLSEYLTALRELRDSSELGWVSTQKLTDRIGALDSALQRSKRTTAEASEEQRQFNQALERSQTKREAEQARALAEAAEQAANAQRESAAASKASADAAKQNASQLQQLIAGYRSLTSVTGAAAGVAGSVGRGIGAVGRGVGAAAKGAVKAGKFGYELGAEFGVFEAPRTGPIKQAIQQVIDRFKFLGEQALTARGAVLRSIEAVGTLAVGNKVVDNIDLIKASLAGIDVAAKAASGGLNILKNTLGAGFNFVGDKLPNNAIGDLSKLIGETIDASAGLGSAGKAFTDFATSGLASGLDGLQAFQQALQNIPPEAQAAALALAGLAAGAISNQTNVSINDIAEALDRVRNNALNVAQALKQINGPTELVMQQNTALQGSGLTDEERQQRARNAARLQALRQFIQEFGAEQRKLAQLALPSSEMLAEGGRRIQRLTPTGLNQSNEAQVAALRQSAEEASKLAAAERVAQGEQTQLNAALEAGFRVLQQMVPIIEEQTQGYKTQTAELRQQLQLLKEKRATEQQRANDARRRLEEDAQRRADERQAANARRARQEAIETGLLGQSSPISGRLPGDRFIPGSPADLKRRADRRQEAASNALIGGAFPLLFGQGLGASIFGGLGGFAGGLKGGQFGFGASLVGTAVGAQFDTASTNAQSLAKALNDPIGKFREVADAGLLSSKGLEKQAQALIDTGREAEAAALIQRDIAKTYGDLGGARDLASTTQELTSNWAKLGVAMTEFTTGPFNGLLKALAGRLGNEFEKSRNVQLEQDLRNAGLGGKADQLRRQSTDLILRGDTAGLSRLNDSFANELPAVKEANAALEKAKALSAEQNKARLAGNNLLAEALQRSEKLAQIEAKRKQDLVGAKTNAERTAINEAAAAEKRDVEEASKAAAEAAKRELSIASQLAGTYGKQRDLIRERVEYEQKRGQFQAVINNPNVSSTDRLTAQRGLDALNINRNDQLDERVRLAKEELEIQSAIVGKNAELRSFITAQIQERRKLNEQLKIQQEARNNFASAVQTAAAVRGNPNSSQQARSNADDDVKDAAKALTAAGADVQAAGKAFFNTVVDAAKQARDNLLNARLNRAEQLSNPDQGLNRFLAQSTVQDRQFKAGAALKPELDAALQSIKSNFGTLDVLSAETKNKIKQFYENLNKTVQVGTINGQALYGQATPPDYKFIQDFISSTKSEQDGQQALSTAISINTEANKALTQGSQLIAENLPGLAKVMADLAGKNWAVSVNVDSQGGVKVAGDANNRALS